MPPGRPSGSKNQPKHSAGGSRRGSGRNNISESSNHHSISFQTLSESILMPGMLYNLLQCALNFNCLFIGVEAGSQVHPFFGMLIHD
jgi:hypothetical protein